MQKTHKFEINALNVIKSFLIIVLSIIGGSNSNSSNSNSSHNKDNNNKIASVSTFNALEQTLFSGNNSNSNNNNNNNNTNTYSNINYNTATQKTEMKIKIDRFRSKQQGYTNSNNNSISNTNYTPVTKINEIIKNVQSAICSTTVSSTVTITTATTTILPISSPTRISQSSNKQTAASWSSVAHKRIDNSNNYGIINIRNSNGKKNKTDIAVGSKFFGDLHQVRLFNEKDLAHGKPQQLNMNLPKVCGRTARITTVNRRQRTKRFIIFDGSGVIKLIIGGSIPIKLISKERSLSNIFNLQMQYTPPPIPLYWWSLYNTTTFAARSGEGKVPLLLANDASRTFVYAVIEKFLESKGLPGTECLMKAICVVTQQPLEDGNIFHEILNAIFIPVAANIEAKYLDSQAAGRYGVDCAKTFAKCPRNISWLNGITFATL